jgi:hypothetical protein
MLMFTAFDVLFRATRVLDFTVNMSFKHVHSAWSESKSLF